MIKTIVYTFIATSLSSTNLAPMSLGPALNPPNIESVENVFLDWDEEGISPLEQALGQAMLQRQVAHFS